MSDNWGSAIYEDGTRVPLGPPQFSIPEDEREIIVDRPGLVMWTRRRDAAAVSGEAEPEG